MRFRRAISSCVLALSAAASAQSPTQEQVQAWFVAELAAAEAFPNFGDHAMHWIVEVHFVPLPAELERLRSEVAGKPEHPDRQSLADYERRLKGQPTLRRKTLWARAQDNWRHNSDVEDPRGVPWDIALTPRSGWHLSTESLQIGDAREGFSKQFDPTSYVRGFWPEAGQLLDGGLTLGNSFFGNLRVEDVGVEGNRWVAHTRRYTQKGAGSYFVDYEGVWDGAAERGFVTRMTQFADNPERSVIERRETAGWEHEPTLNRWVARRAELYGRDGRLDRVLRFDGVTPGSKGRFEEVTRIPRHDRDDPVRGKLSFTRIMDYGKGTIEELGETERVVAQMPPGLVGNKVARSSSWHRWIGWTAAGALVVAFGALRVRRHLSSD